MAKKVDYQLERLYEALVNQSLNSLDEGVMDMLRKGGAKVAKFFKGSKKPKAPEEPKGPPRKKSLGELADERRKAARGNIAASMAMSTLRGTASDIGAMGDPSLGAESDVHKKSARRNLRVARVLRQAAERSKARKQGK